MRRRPNQLGQRRRSPIVWPCLAALGLFLAAQGCRRHDPATEKIQADDTANFFWWKRTVASQLNPEVQRHLEATLQEVRLDIMSRREASGHDAIEAALCRRLNRLSMNDALLLGGQLKWRRLITEHTDLLGAIDTNALLVTKPGDRAAARELERIRGNQQQRLAALAAELSTAENEISQLGGDVSALRLALPAAPPEAISHAEALENVAGLLNGRRAAALLKYGGWPIKIDWSGQQLDEAKRAEFLAQKASSTARKIVVVPVRIKGQWLLFEGADEAPALPGKVRAALNPAEQASFKRDWLEVEAELWARKAAAELPPPARP